MLTASRWQEASQGWTSKDQASTQFAFGGVSFHITFFVLLTMLLARFLSSEVTVEGSDDCTHAAITGPSNRVFTSEKKRPIF